MVKIFSANYKQQLKNTVSVVMTLCFSLYHVPTKDSHWTKELYKTPKITFGTIIKFLVDRKVMLQRAVNVENIADKRESCAIEKVGE